MGSGFVGAGLGEIGPYRPTPAACRPPQIADLAAPVHSRAPGAVRDHRRMSLDHLRHLRQAQEDFLALLPDADPRVPVPWCGRWTVRDLAVHLARIHHWAAGQARRTSETPLGRGPFDLPELYGRCAAELRAVLDELSPQAPAWTLDGDGLVSFWHRRQLHETLVHLWDLRAALAVAAAAGTRRAGGGAGVRAPADAPIPRLDLSWSEVAAPEVWADTVDEVVTVMYPRQVRLGRCTPLPAALTLTASDTGDRWTPEHLPGAPPVEVTGPAAALALLLWRRALPQDPVLRVTGDAAALDEALLLRLTP